MYVFRYSGTLVHSYELTFGLIMKPIIQFSYQLLYHNLYIL